jgi:hypothetical protein
LQDPVTTDLVMLDPVTKDLVRPDPVTLELEMLATQGRAMLAAEGPAMLDLAMLDLGMEILATQLEPEIQLEVAV